MESLLIGQPEYAGPDLLLELDDCLSLVIG